MRYESSALPFLSLSFYSLLSFSRGFLSLEERKGLLSYPGQSFLGKKIDQKTSNPRSKLLPDLFRKKVNQKPSFYFRKKFHQKLSSFRLFLFPRVFRLRLDVPKV